MNKIRGLGILFFCILPIILAACSYKEFEDSLKNKLNQKSDNYSNPAKIVDDSSEDEKQGFFSIGDTIVHTYPGNEIVQYTLNQVNIIDNIKDLGLKADDFYDKSLISNNGDIKKENRLVIVDVTVKNVNYEADDSEADDPIMPTEPSVGFKEGIEDPDGPMRIQASYFSAHQPERQDYYQLFLPIGDEIDVTVGWFAPVDQLEEEPLYYIIGDGGNAEDFQYFELNFN